MRRNKTKTVEELASKGAEWCAKRLYEVKAELEETRERLMREQNTNSRYLMNKNIEQANNNLASVLEEMGVRPTRLRVYYLRKPCEDCEDIDREWWEDCQTCDLRSDYVETTSWYTYQIKDGLIAGILSNFEDGEFDCYKIVNEKTGEVLYESEESEDER